MIGEVAATIAIVTLLLIIFEDAIFIFRGDK